MKRILLSGSLALLLGGCAQNILTHEEATAGIKNSQGPTTTPNKFKGSMNSAKVQDGWIRTFHDPKLNSLVKEAQRNNPNLKVAAARVERAVALTQLTESELKPSIGASAYYRDNNAVAAQK